MKSGHRCLMMWLAGWILCFLSHPFCTVFAAQPDGMAHLAESFTSFQQAFPEDRVYLMTDKSFYFPGETLWFSAFVRNGSDLSPSVKSEILHVEWIAPSGNVEKELTLIARNGTGAGDISLSADAAGGIYTLRAYTQWQKNDPDPLFFEKKIPVQQVVVPRVKLTLDYERETYGKGDEVRASLEAKGRDDSPLTNHPFTYVLSLSGKKILENKGITDDDGNALIRFKLPETLDTADGLLRVNLDYQGVPESISRSVPLLDSTLEIGIFPEGGDLVTGLPSQVAFLALDEWGKPADVNVRVETQAGKAVTECKTVHQGMGVFDLTPAADTQYRLRVLAPKGIDTLYPLPAALPRGYVLRVGHGSGHQLKIRVNSTEKEDLTLAIRSRDNTAQFVTLKALKGENTTSFDTHAFPMGVCQVTLFDARGIERAERLVFVNPDKTLSITMVTDKEVYQPREKVTMLIGVADERGMPLPSQLALTVTDDRLLSFADDKDGRIFSRLLLEPDLKGEVFEAGYYFNPDNKDREKALDLVMMTQGWRRFTWKAIRAKDKPSLSFAGEKAEIRGFVYEDRRSRKPVPHAQVTVSDTKTTVITDDTGAFVITDLDLYEAKLLTAKDGNNREASVSVTSYSETPIIYIEPPVRVLRRKLMNRLGWGGPEPVPEAMDGMAVVAEAEPPMMMQAVADEAPPAEEVAKEEVLVDPRIPRPVIEPPMDEERAAQPVYTRAREFPEVVYQTTQTEVRNDFRSTLYFNGNIETDRRGMAQITFYNSDAVTSFRAMVEGIGAGGLAGRNETVYATRLPFSLDARAPVSVAMGDRMILPVTLTNATADPITGRIHLTVPDALKALSPTEKELTVKARTSLTISVPFKVLDRPGVAKLMARFESGSDKDTFQADIRVVPRGFPVRLAFSAQEKEATYQAAIHKPVKGSITATFTAYPTVLSDMLEGIQSILKEPFGCFEQASSSTYPNIMVLDYMRHQERPDPAVTKKARDLIGKGYTKLTAYETGEKGYEWFGQTPAHEALSAYGLMEFADMKKVWPQVDDAMVKRTASWLLKRRDGKGGFLRSDQALDSFGRADEDITNAYIVYALSEAGFVFEIQKELDAACESALSSDDAYILALVANALYNVKDERSKKVMARLLPHQAENGSFTGKKHSITRSTGKALSVETTALAVMAMIKSAGPDMTSLDKAVRFIVSSRSTYGGFGNTQATVLALKALSAFSVFARQTAEAGNVAIEINGKPAGKTSYDKGEKQKIEIGPEVLTPHFDEGDHTIRVHYSEVKNPLPYTVSITYNTLLPPSSEAIALSLETDLEDHSVKMGDTVRMTVKLINTKEEGLPMSVAVIGIPGGLSVQPWQIKELQEKKRVDYVEVLNNDLVLYYRQMKPTETRTVALDLKAEVPGDYEAAASSAYLYYTNELKAWVKGEHVKIKEP